MSMYCVKRIVWSSIITKYQYCKDNHFDALSIELYICRCFLLSPAIITNKDNAIA